MNEITKALGEMLPRKRFVDYDKGLQRVHASVVSGDMSITEGITEVKNVLKKFTAQERAVLTYLSCIDDGLASVEMKIISMEPLVMQGYLYNRPWKFTAEKKHWEYVLWLDPFRTKNDTVEYAGDAPEDVTPESAEYVLTQCFGQAMLVIRDTKHIVTAPEPADERAE